MVKKADEVAVSLQPVNVMADSPFPGLTFAGDLDDLEDQPLEIAMNDKSFGYINGRVLATINELFPGRLTHLRFLPDVQNGMVIMIPTANEKAYGATPVVYSPTENGAEISLRLAIKRLKVVPQAGRIHRFPVTIRKGADGKDYLAFVTKDAATKPAKKRSKSAPAPVQVAAPSPSEQA